MAGTSDNLRTDQIILGAGKIYGKVAIPGAAGRMTIDASTLTPDATANPLAIHLGGTQAGAKAKITTSYDEYFIDEQAEPIQTNLSTVAASIEGAFAGVRNMDIAELLTPGTGTQITASGYEQVKFGSRSVAYTSIAIVAPRADDATKVVVFQLYRAVNTTGLEVNFGRKELNFSPFNFKGYSVAGRAATDTYASFWWQIT